MSSLTSGGVEVELADLESVNSEGQDLNRALRRLSAPANAAQIEQIDLFAAEPRLFSTASWRCLRTKLPLLGADLLAVAGAGAIAQLALHFCAPGAAPAIAGAAPLTLLALIAVYALGGSYFGCGTHPVVELRHVVHLTTIWLLAGVVGARLHAPFIVWAAVVWFAAIGLVPMARAVTRYFCSHRSWWGYPALIVGSAQSAPQVAHMLQRDPESGLRPVAITDPAARCQFDVLPVLNEPESLESFVRARAIQHAVIALPELSNSRMAEVIDRYSKLVPHLLILSDYAAMPGLWGTSRSYGRWTALEVQNRSIRAALLLVKRFVDLAGALLLLMIGLPVILAVALLVKLTSRGPVIYGHTRIGSNGIPFSTWKFRTMYRDSADLLRDHLERDSTAREEWDRAYKLRDDPRLTPIGGFLRKSSLDELPQLWNVLKGEMSLVGPRPIVADEIPKYGDIFKLYKTVKPGLTGFWQVSGRNDVTYEDRVWLDQYYIRNWSPWLDLYILPQTVVALLRRTGAY